MTFCEALRLNNDDFRVYAAEQNRLWRERMIAEGMIYFPTLDRWFPAGTEIAGCEPEDRP